MTVSQVSSSADYAISMELRKSDKLLIDISEQTFIEAFIKWDIKHNKVVARWTVYNVKQPMPASTWQAFQKVCDGFGAAVV